MKTYPMKFEDEKLLEVRRVARLEDKNIKQFLEAAVDEALEKRKKERSEDDCNN